LKRKADDQGVKQIDSNDIFDYDIDNNGEMKKWLLNKIVSEDLKQSVVVQSSRKERRKNPAKYQRIDSK
jgi:hypothetical protein